MTMNNQQYINLQTGLPKDLYMDSLSDKKDQTAVTVALSNHRCEIIPLAVAKMRQHVAVILEEPPERNFFQLLEGEITIAEYMLEIDAEYPEFNRRMYQAMRRLYHEGVRILQIEPYLERLIEIHRRFSEGAGPEDLKTHPTLWPVYEMEHRATRALINFYEASSQGDFDILLETVKAFARIDARRFVLRDQLRAQGIAEAIGPGERVYVEAGSLHVGLARELRRQSLAKTSIVNHFFSPRSGLPKSSPMTLYGPGDILTLVYMFNHEFDGLMADLWAARALVQNKIIIKNEITDRLEEFPHTRDEAKTARLVHQLDLKTCRHLILQIDKMTTAQARRTVMETLISVKTNPLSQTSATKVMARHVTSTCRKINDGTHAT